MKRLIEFLTAVAAFVAGLVATADTASAASKATYYLALGDSLAAGCHPSVRRSALGGTSLRPRGGRNRS
jgi:hypothetical protein